MLSIACGGAHRFWHFRTQDSELNNAMFTFIRREYVRDILESNVLYSILINNDRFTHTHDPKKQVHPFPPLSCSKPFMVVKLEWSSFVGMTPIVIIQTLAYAV